MKQVTRLVLTGTVMLVSLCEGRTLVDKIVARVGGINVLYSDVHRPRISGKPGSVEETIRQEMLFQEAAKHYLVPPAEELQRYIADYKVSNGLKDASDDEVDSQLQKHGFTLKQYRQELARHVAVTRLIHNEVEARVFVSAQEVEQYFARHPKWTSEELLLETAIVPFDQVEDPKDLASRKDIEWIKTDEWIAPQELADHMQFVAKLKKGETSKPVKTEDGYQLVRIVDKKQKRKQTLAERYKDIENILKEKKSKELRKSFEEDIRDRTYIVRLDS